MVRATLTSEYNDSHLSGFLVNVSLSLTFLSARLLSIILSRCPVLVM